MAPDLPAFNAARALRNAPVEITVLDRHNYHCFQPLLYQVATATLSAADIAWPIRTLLRDQKNVTVLLAAVTGIDAKAKLILAGGEAFPFDYLILAPGATALLFRAPRMGGGSTRAKNHRGCHGHQARHSARLREGRACAKRCRPQALFVIRDRGRRPNGG